MLPLAPGDTKPAEDGEASTAHCFECPMRFKASSPVHTALLCARAARGCLLQAELFEARSYNMVFFSSLSVRASTKNNARYPEHDVHSKFVSYGFS